MHHGKPMEIDICDLNVQAPRYYDGYLDFADKLVESFWDKLQNDGVIRDVVNKVSDGSLGDDFLGAIKEGKDKIIADAKNHTKKIEGVTC